MHELYAPPTEELVQATSEKAIAVAEPSSPPKNLFHKQQLHIASLSDVRMTFSRRGLRSSGNLYQTILS